MKTARDLINDNSESIVWHEAEIRVIEKLMEEFASQDKWISVEERLPEIGIDFLGFDNKSISLYVATTDKLCKVYGVKFWQPLPKPPNTK